MLWNSPLLDFFPATVKYALVITFTKWPPAHYYHVPNFHRRLTCIEQPPVSNDHWLAV